MKLNSSLTLIFISALAGAGGFAAYNYLAQDHSKQIKSTATPTKKPSKPASNKTIQTATAEKVMNITVSDIKANKKPIRPDFSLPDLEGELRSISDWNGKIIILNFWATWCPPCKKEMPAFVELQAKYAKQGVQFIGVAIDQKNLVQDFVDSIGVTYPILIGELGALDINQQYGNSRGQLPYTIFINRQKQIVGVKRGEITKQQTEDAIKALLK